MHAVWIISESIVCNLDYWSVFGLYLADCKECVISNHAIFEYSSTSVQQPPMGQQISWCCWEVTFMERSGPSCSKLTTSLVNVSLNFQTLISEICQYFLLKKCEKLLQCKSLSHFFNKKYQCILL